MIELIKIKNLALVKENEIEFGSGFNVITGETGAGKTVIMKALALLLGERAGRNIIRNGEDKCEISAIFNLKNLSVDLLDDFLKEAGFELDSGILVIRRVISKSSSRNFINDTPVTLAMLKHLGDRLIDIHGPYEHQSLLHPSHQLSILDAFGNLSGLKKRTEDWWWKYKSVEEELQELEKDLPSPIEAEHLRGIVKSIEDADLKSGEDREIAEKHKVLANSKEIIETISSAVKLLNDSDNGVSNILVEIRRALISLKKLEISELDNFLKECDNIMNAVRELAFDLDNFSSQTEIDESAFFEIENRLNVLQTLKRKYGSTIEDIEKTKSEALEKLDKLDNFEYLMNDLKKQKEDTFRKFETAAEELSEKRKKTADSLSKKITKTLQTLGFKNAKFFVEFKKSQPSGNGIDSIEFLFSANRGESVNPLKEVASSGEISRVMLALKTVIADADSIPILVFDEIDVNIGGETAVVVGQKLKNLSKSHQLLCISHLPMVAACADRHYKVQKSVINERTVSQIELLDKCGRLEEIARMLGGGSAARNHAKKLLD
jgi:DNA repair protein RecN (Recombination protein N)